MFELSAGQIVADKYRIDGVMGTGGMGVVVAATHVELDQRVAIKFLREVSPEGLARFQREARLLVRLKSPHVARVFDVGALDDDTPYIVMEHLDGSDLASVSTTRGRLPVEEAVDYILQACEALAEAHALGMVHRDLKPANLFLARGPGGTTTVKVLDFGVSKILDDRSQGTNGAARGGDLTNEGVALGSPGYMSPEQMTSSRDVDERSDIFSLGALLYRFVSGQPPYKGKTVVSILASMAIEPLVKLRTLVPEAPEGFAATVERCLAHDKAARYPTIAHLAHALIPYATRRGRVIIEQILATLNVTFPDEGLGDTMVRHVQAPTGPGVRRPGAGETGPHFSASAAMGNPGHGSGPRAGEVRRADGPRITPLAAAIIFALTVLAGYSIFRAVRRPARESVEPATSVTAPALSTPAISTPPSAAAVPSASAPALAPTPIMTSEPSAEPAAPARPSRPARPRPGGRH